MPAHKQILLRIRDEFLGIMCEVNPDYRAYVQYDNANKVLFLKVLRAIYGCIESTLLWYNFYLKTFKYLRFSINTYNRCTSNKIIDGKQCTIVWYVDDNKLSHVDPNVVTDILEEINNHFGDLVINRGDTHNLLGTTIKIWNDKKVDLVKKHKIEDTVSQFKDICDFKVNLSCA